MTAPPASLDLRNVSAAVRQQEVLHDVSFQVPPGESFVVIGAPGSGKSTLLRLVAGLERLSGGEIWLDDRNIGRLAPRHRQLALLLQTYALWPNLNVVDNVAFALHGRAKQVRRRCAAELADLGLADFHQHMPAQLSASQQQRVALARTLAAGARLCLLDEPFSAQPATLRERLARLLRQRRQRDGFTTLMATSDGPLGMRMADRLAVLHAGEVHQVGTPAELYDYPLTRQVASLTGPANLFDGEVERDGERAMFHTANGLLIPLLDTAPRRERHGTAMFRPGALRIVDASSPPVRDEVRLRGRIADIAFLGDSLRCEVEITDAVAWLDVRRTDLASMIDVGDVVDLGLDPRQTRILGQ